MYVITILTSAAFLFGSSLWFYSDSDISLIY